MKAVIKSQKGFSLVELMVVVAIIGILAAIAVPNYQRFTAKSKQAEAKSNLSAVYSAERAFFAEWQTFQGGFAIVGYQPTGTLRYRHGFSANIALPNNHPQFAVNPNPADFNTSLAAVCGQGAFGGPGNVCKEQIAPVAPGALAAVGGQTPAIVAGPPPTFIAQARGDIDGDATVDIWHMNERKEVTQPAVANDDVNN